MLSRGVKATPGQPFLLLQAPVPGLIELLEFVAGEMEAGGLGILVLNLRKAFLQNIGVRSQARETSSISQGIPVRNKIYGLEWVNPRLTAPIV